LGVKSIDAVLLDIEGTLSSQSYVAKTLFPFSRARIPGYVAEHGNDPDVIGILADAAGLADPGEDAVAALLRWIDEDKKTAPLKALQGLVWDEGYASGALHGHIYPDSLAALRRWKDAGLPRHIYSSGSARAQVQFFRNSTEGDLRELFNGHFDLAVGPKVEAASYVAIAQALNIAPARLRFFSDNPRELVAARAAGMQVVQVIREDTAPDPRFVQVYSFDEAPVWAD
jgi:enolase-phosphatase E1